MALGVFNIEISIFKSGCGFSPLSFTMEVYATLAIFVVVAACFLVLGLFRAQLLRSAHWLEARVEPRFPACFCRRKVGTRSHTNKATKQLDAEFAGACVCVCVSMYLCVCELCVP
jgi:hypothetical protein